MRRIACGIFVAGGVACAAMASVAAPKAHAPAARPAPPPATTPPAGPSSAMMAQVEAQLLKIPVYPVMKAYYPDVYAGLLKSIRDGLAQGHTILSLQGDVRRAYLPLLKAQMPKAEPDLVVQLLRVSREETEAVKSSPSDCMALMGLIPFQRRADEIIPADLAQRELRIDAEILKQTATRPYSPDPARLAKAPTAAQMAALAYDALPSDDSRRRFTTLADRLAQAQDPADRQMVCEYMLGFFDALLKQTPEDATAVFARTAEAKP